ncbi:MAG: hypothetical protein WCR30_02170 [Clostridia bacterium]
MWLGHLGFSYVGLLYIAMITIPNLIWTKHQPANYTAKNENKILSYFERIGQFLVTPVSVMFIDFNINEISLWSIWLVISFLVMILYEIWWIRYFKSKKQLQDFYSSILGVPVAGATLPVIGFFLLGIYGKNIWLIISIIMLGIGHIGIHFQHKNEIKQTN